MKIAIVTSFPAQVDQPVGGVEAVSVNLVGALAAMDGLDVHVITLDADVQQDERSTWERATIHRLPLPTGSMLTMAVGSGRRLVSSYVRRLAPDLVHAHDTYGLMIKGLDLPRVFTVHGFIYGDTLVSNSRFARLRALLWKWVETSGWADQPNIISISPYVRERVSQYSRANIRDIDNPISEIFFNTPRKTVRPSIFSAAVISQRKNTIKLVEAVKCMRDAGDDVELRLAGPIVEAAYGEQLIAFIAQSGLKDHVHLLGSIPSSRVLEELREASVFALVSLEENSPMGIEEAMAMRLPVVSSNRCGMPYMIDHGVSGYLVDPFDPADIARGLQRAMGTEERVRQLGEASREIAQRRFHPTVVAQKTLEFYREIV